MASAEQHNNDSQPKVEHHGGGGGFLGLGNLVSEAWDAGTSGMSSLVNAGKDLAGTELHGLEIIGNGIATGASDLYGDAKQFAKDHHTLTNLAIDGISGVAALGVGVLTSFTGPGALGLGALTGAAVDEGLHAALGQPITLRNAALNVTSGAIDGISGGLASSLEKAAAGKLVEWGVGDAIQNGAERLGLENGGKFFSNLLIKGATDLHINPESLAQLSARSATISRMLGVSTDVARSRIYQSIVGKGLWVPASAVVGAAIPGK